MSENAWKSPCAIDGFIKHMMKLHKSELHAFMCICNMRKDAVLTFTNNPNLPQKWKMGPSDLHQELTLKRYCLLRKTIAKANSYSQNQFEKFSHGLCWRSFGRRPHIISYITPISHQFTACPYVIIIFENLQYSKQIIHISLAVNTFWTNRQISAIFSEHRKGFYDIRKTS